MTILPSPTPPDKNRNRISRDVADRITRIKRRRQAAETATGDGRPTQPAWNERALNSDLFQHDSGI